MTFSPFLHFVRKNCRWHFLPFSFLSRNFVNGIFILSKKNFVNGISRRFVVFSVLCVLFLSVLNSVYFILSCLCFDYFPLALL